MGDAKKPVSSSPPRAPAQESPPSAIETERKGPTPHVGGEVAVDDLVRSVRAEQRERYRAEGEVAAGGMGTVYQVLDRPLQRRIAKKEIHDHLAQKPDQARMFLREARLTGQLDHPNVVPVHELGVSAEGRLFFTMKMVEGRTLRSWIGDLPETGPIERGELLDILDVVIKVCDALAFAHSRGILHCDVKAANVMVGEFGQVYLMDWGVARLLEEERNRDAVDNEEYVVGTPAHMPPEQARGAPLDERADIFAVGALLYNVLTRRPPYRGDSGVQVLAQAFLARYPLPDEVMGSGVVPLALTRIVLRAMAPKREERFATVLELKDELVKFTRGGEGFEAVVFNAGDVVVQEGEAGEEAFIIESGRCEVTQHTEQGDKRIRIMESGEVFGEMAILSPGVRTATVRAIERSVLRRVTAATLRRELDSMKPWMGAFVRTLADRFRERESS